MRPIHLGRNRCYSYVIEATKKEITLTPTLIFSCDKALDDSNATGTRRVFLLKTLTSKFYRYEYAEKKGN
ncbi:MAG: hypothetical protein KAI83_14175 [Thiomargarita sp.]|nr:hypothetical protein [Thiomargarita sp.]